VITRDGKVTVGNNHETVVQGNTKITNTGNFDLFSGGNNKYTAKGDQDFRTFNRQTSTADQPSKTRADVADTAAPISKLSVHNNPTTSTTNGWDRRYQGDLTTSIMKRVPMHEPWILHENQAPQFLTPENTDRERNE
jgi:hypothetical protein